MPKKPLRPRKPRRAKRAPVRPKKKKAPRRPPIKRRVKHPAKSKVKRRAKKQIRAKAKPAVKHKAKAAVHAPRKAHPKAKVPRKAAKRAKKSVSKLSREQRREKYLTAKILSTIKDDTAPGSWTQGWGDYKNNFIKEWKEGDRAYGRVVQYTLPYNPEPNPPPNSWGHVTLSEGMGYGMRLAVKNHDQVTFDAMLRFLKQSCGRNGLMQWCIDQRGVSDCPADWEGSSSDADIDIAYALCCAADLAKEGVWNFSPHLDYEAMAKQMIRSIRTHNLMEVPLGESGNGLILLPGTRLGEAAKHNFNPSHVAPVEMMMFKQHEPGYDWEGVIHNNIALIIKSAHPKTGLVPEGYNPFDPSDPTHFGNTYSYDACRLPMRLAEYFDYLANLSQKERLTERQMADMEAVRTLLSKQFHFFCTHRHPDGGIYSGYTLGGSPKVKHGSEACFNGPVALALAIMLKHKAIDRQHCRSTIGDLEQLQLAAQVIVMKSVSPVPKAGDSPDKSGPYYNSSLASLILSRMKEVKDK